MRRHRFRQILHIFVLRSVVVEGLGHNAPDVLKNVGGLVTLQASPGQITCGCQSKVFEYSNDELVPHHALASNSCSNSLQLKE